MSARECLDHAWMKADLSKAKIPPQPIQKSQTSPSVTEPTPVSPPSAVSLPSTAVSPLFGAASISIYSPALMSALSDITSTNRSHSRSCGSLGNTPIALTPNNTTPTVLTPVNTTPTVLTPMSSSPRDIGLPPLHPYSGPRTSSVNSTHSSTNSLYRGGSRQSLDRARSLSKSREVLYERMQMSNQKKLLSKSRERLHERHLLSRSRENLLAFKSFSHSEETLSVFNWLNNDDSLYQSCSSVFQPMLPMLDEDRVSGRLYKSLASIDKIDEVGTDVSTCNERQSLFDSRFSINDEDYNNLITRYNTAVNSHRRTPPRGRKSEGRARNNRSDGRLRGSGQGGRGSSTCDKQCSRHSRPAEPQLTQKSPKVSKAERMKRDGHRRRKGKKEKEKQRTESKRPQSPAKSPITTDTDMMKHAEKPSCSGRASSPGKRRGSVSHVEQRIQERHERQQERERQEKQERRGSGKSGASNSKRRDSGEEKHSHKEKSKNNKNKGIDTNTNRPRSISPSKRRVNKTNSISSEGSTASSFESVKELTEYKKASPKNSLADFPKKSPRNSIGATNDFTEPRERRTDMDEAYVSLEEPVDDGIFSRSESMDSTMTLESDHTVRETDTSSDTIESAATPVPFPDLCEPLRTSEILISKVPAIQDPEPVKKEPETTSSTPKVEKTSSESMPELSAINEEEEDEKSVFARSVSTSSDIGSMLSENSEADKEETSSKSTEAHDTENADAVAWRRRGRSMSMQPSDPRPFTHLHLCRSNSFNLVMPLGSLVASPWGDVCEGAVTRALEMFKLKPSDMTSASRNFLERRASLQSQ